MENQWFYRVFGQEFGPVPLDELTSQLELGVLSPTDDVRPTSSSTWVSAASVDGLGRVGKPTKSAPASSGTAQTGANDWYCRLLDQEIGPLCLDELVAFAEQGQLTGNDEVKLGPTGKWRRAGTLGRLAAVLPYQDSAVEIPVTALREAMLSTCLPTENPPEKTRPPETAVVATAKPKSSPRDTVAAEVTCPSVAAAKRPAETVTRTTVQSAIESTATGIRTVESSTIDRGVPRNGTVPQPHLRPIAPQRDAVDWIEKLKQPWSLCTGAFFLIAILYFGSQYLPQGSASDRRRYTELKQILDEIRSKRSQSSKDFAELKAKAQKVSEEVIMALKDHATVRYPAKQHLLRAARDDLPILLMKDLTAESSTEKSFANRLSDAELALGLK